MSKQFSGLRKSIRKSNKTRGKVIDYLEKKLADDTIDSKELAVLLAAAKDNDTTAIKMHTVEFGTQVNVSHEIAPADNIKAILSSSTAKSFKYGIPEAKKISKDNFSSGQLNDHEPLTSLNDLDVKEGL